MIDGKVTVASNLIHRQRHAVGILLKGRKERSIDVGRTYDAKKEEP